ncbi:hypothetical protein ABPG74_022259 [Tetrahymena malaccensis]
MIQDQVTNKVTQKDIDEDTEFKTETISREKKNLVYIKPNASLALQLLQQTKPSSQSNEKLVINNKIIKDLLNENKKGKTQDVLPTQSDSSTTKLQQHLQQKIQKNSIQKRSDDTLDINGQVVKQENDDRMQNLKPKQETQLNVKRLRQMTEDSTCNQQTQNINSYSNLGSPIDSKKIPIRLNESNINKRSSVQLNHRNSKQNIQAPFSFIQISAKFRDDSKQNQGNISTTSNGNLTLSQMHKLDDTYKIKTNNMLNSNRRINGSDISSVKSLREVKSNDQANHTSKVIENSYINQRNLSTNMQASSSIYNVRNSITSQFQIQTQHNFSKNQIPSPTGFFEGFSKINQNYYPQATLGMESTRSQNKDKFLYTLKINNVNTDEQDNNIPSLQSIQANLSNPPSSYSQKHPLVKPFTQIDLSQVPPTLGSMGEILTFRSNMNNNGHSTKQGQSTTASINLNINGGFSSTKSKKFAQSFTQLTKIVTSKQSPDKSPKNQNQDLYYKNQDNEKKQSFIKIIKEDQSIQSQLESSLKKEVPSALSEGPTSRQELIQMQKWFQNSLNQIQKMNNSKKVDHLSSLVELACQELLRQISIECQERGDLLQSVMKYQVFSLREQIEKQRVEFEKIKKQQKDEYLSSHKTYEGIFQSKDEEISKLKSQLSELHSKLKENITQMEDKIQNDKILRDQLTKFKELVTYMKQKQSESQLENYKLRKKIKKVGNKLKDDKKEQNTSSFSKGQHQLESGSKTHQTNTEQNNNQSHESSINSDLFIVDENKPSERLINIGGVNESIEKLNYVRYTNPEDVKKLEVNQTQTGASLLVLNDMREAEVQTELVNLLDDEYDSILQDKLTFDQFMYKVENQEAQVEYLKEREINLIEQIESLKAQMSRADEQQANALQNFQITSPLILNVASSSRYSGQDFDVSSLASFTPHLKKKVDTVDTLLTEKYKNIMQKLNLDSKNVSESVSSDSSFDEDEEDSPVPISKDEKAARRAKRQNLIKAVQKKTNVRQLGEKINQVESLFNDIGRQIVEKVKKNKYYKFRNFMPLPTLLKQINLVYLERMRMINENPRIKEQECSNFTYFFLTKLYGFKKIVDQKFIIFMLSIKKYLSILRVNMFARFIGLIENRTLNFSLDECNKYIEVLNYVFNISTFGQQPNPIENDAHYMIPFIRAMAFVGNFVDSRMTYDEQTEFKKDIESLKEIDSKGIHTNGIIDFDVFLNKMLAKYRQLVNRAKTYVINAFAASDLDGNGVCNLDEFLILNRHIEVDIYDEDVLTQIFQENADRIIDSEPNLSFDKFAVVCVDYNLFSDEQQDKFLGIRHKREIDFKMQELQTEWIFRRRELKAIFEQLNLISAEQKEKWLQIIDVLNDKLQTAVQDEFKPLLIAYKILQNESKTLLSLEEEVKRDEELLNQYHEKALKDQKEQQNSFQILDQSSRLSENSSPKITKKNRSGGNSITQMLQIPVGNSIINLSGQKRVSQYATQSQQQSSLSQIPQVFTFSNPSLTNQQSSTSITNIVSSQASTTNIEQNLKDANFIELMLQKLKKVQNKEKFLVNILLKNGVEEPTENDINQIQSIILALDQNTASNEQQQNVKQILFSFLMRQINQSKKTSNSQTLIQ